MILVDERTGSREQLQLLRNLGVDAELGGRLAGDFQFPGHGPDGDVLVGIERKALSDMLESMRSRRLAGQQLQPFVSTYDVPLLVIEGIWRRQRDTGFIEVPSGRGWIKARGSFYYAELDSFVCSLRELAGVAVWRTGDPEETCAWIVSCYKWWQKDWAEHRSLQSVYAPAPVAARTGHRASGLRKETTLAEEWASRLPGIDGRAIEYAARFASAWDMANASVEGILEVTEGLRIGRKTAENIAEAVRAQRSL